MNNYQIIFSPTGGTEKVANAITQTYGTINLIRQIQINACFYISPLKRASISDAVYNTSVTITLSSRIV